MVALNGTSLNGTSLHDAPVNGGSVLPVMLPRPVGGSRPRDTSEDYQHHDLTQQDSAHLTIVDRRPHPSAVGVEEELARLEAEVVSAKARAEVAKDRLADRLADVCAALRAELIASRDAVAKMEREYETTLAIVRAAAQTEVQRIRAEAGELAESPSPAVLRDDRLGTNDG